MFSFIRQIFVDYKKTSRNNQIIRDYDMIECMIRQCHTMNDFIYCKKKITYFNTFWDKNDPLVNRLYSKLNNQYIRRLRRKRYYIELYAKKKKKT
tara:strand:- start:2371 stop:2655 length:285 start_codon:yes stop_codon:yes gene_type:complete